MKKIGLFIVLFLLSVGAKAQIDTEFWFAAPDLEVNHAQVPVRFCIVSYDDAATVVFERPANPDLASRMRRESAESIWDQLVQQLV